MTSTDQLDKYEAEVQRILGDDQVSLQDPLEANPTYTESTSFTRAMANVNAKLDYVRGQV